MTTQLSTACIMDPITYLSQVRFHQSIQCPRTRSRVTFALGGEGWDPAVTQYYGRIARPSSPITAYRHSGPLLLYILPSGCSRLIGMLLEGICRSCNVSILAIDRPGSGGTAMCRLQDRIEVTTQQTISVLEALQLDRQQHQIRLVTHSSGWFYALALLEAAPHYFARPGSPARAVFSSPFVPTSLSSSTLLSILPKGVVALWPTVMPFLSRSLSWSTGLGDDILSISKGFVLSKDAPIDPDLSREQQRLEHEKLEEKNRQVRARSKQKSPNAQFHPPYDSHLKLGIDAWKRPDMRPEERPLHPKTKRPLKSGADLLFDYFIEEGSMTGMANDFLLCLGKAPNLDNEALQRQMLRGLEASFQACASLSGKPLELAIVWGEADFLIPRKGREYLASALKMPAIAQSMVCQEWIMAEGGHDATLFSADVMHDVLKFLIGDAMDLDER